MAKCKFCGQGVRTAPVFHPACWEQRANKVMEAFCDEYCRFPREIEDHDNLIEQAPLCRTDGRGFGRCRQARRQLLRCQP